MNSTHQLMTSNVEVVNLYSFKTPPFTDYIMIIYYGLFYFTLTKLTFFLNSKLYLAIKIPTSQSLDFDIYQEFWTHIIFGLTFEDWYNLSNQ